MIVNDVFVCTTALGIDPEFDTQLSNVTVIRGETATLPCAIDSLGKFKVTVHLTLGSHMSVQCQSKHPP